MAEVSDASLGGVYSMLPPNLQFLPMTIVASAAVIIIYAGVLAIARAFNSQETERFAKAELLNSFATILMVSFLILMLNSVEEFMLQYFICSGVNCPAFECGGEYITIEKLTNSIDLLKCRLADKANAFADIQGEVTDAAAVPLNLLNLYISLIGVPVFSGQYVSSWYKDAETYRLLNQLMTVLLIGLNTIIITADYVKNNMLSFFLPIGLLLRSFFFTRGVGAFLIALALGFYYIYPVVYIITDPGFVKPAYQAPAKPAGFDAPLCFPTFSGLSYSIYSTFGSTATSSSGSSKLSLDQLRSDVSSVYSSVLLQPFIAFALTIVLIRYMITVLGWDSMDLLRAMGKVV